MIKFSWVARAAPLRIANGLTNHCARLSAEINAPLVPPLRV